MKEQACKKVDAAVQRLNDLRGLMAIWIVFGHIGISMSGKNGLFLMMEKLNLAIVGMFFFLSGYGLEKSLERKEGYLNSFIPKKAARLLLMTWVQFGVTELCLYLVSFPRDYSGVSGVLKEYANNLNWYMWEIAIMYLIFFISHIIFKDRKAYFAAAILALALTEAILYYLGAYAACYSCLAFPAGMIFYSKREIIGRNEASMFGNMFILAMALCCATGFSMVLPKESTLAVLGKNFFCVSFAFFMLVLFLRLDISSKILKFLAKISPEIYLYQFPAGSVLMALYCRGKGKPREYMYAFLVFALTMIMALVIYALRRMFEKVISNEN
jgi:peptidoglycan/LPS O-acetylase OafA/YrhL